MMGCGPEDAISQLALQTRHERKRHHQRYDADGHADGREQRHAGNGGCWRRASRYRRAINNSNDTVASHLYYESESGLDQSPITNEKSQPIGGLIRWTPSARFGPILTHFLARTTLTLCRRQPSVPKTKTVADRSQRSRFQSRSGRDQTPPWISPRRTNPRRAPGPRALKIRKQTVSRSAGTLVALAVADAGLEDRW